jgi:hypothetical protein
MMIPNQPWKPADATDQLRLIGRNEWLTINRTNHFIQRLLERDLIIGDALHVLKNGFVYDEPEPSTKEGFYKYKMESTTPNSNNRVVRVVVIPDVKNKGVKFVTIMWVDELS